MKRFILLAALAASFSLQAQTLEASNKAGGKVVLTLRQGVCPDNQYQAYSTTSTGNTEFACWADVDGRAFVRYDSGDVRVYEAKQFTLKGVKKASQ